MSIPSPVIKGIYTGEKLILALEPMTVAELPAPSQSRGMEVFVTDEAGGSQPCYSDGADWRRMSDRVIVSVLDTVWIINGQSPAASIPPLTLGYSAVAYLLGSDLLGFSDAAGAFRQLVDGSANSKVNAGGGGTGPGPGAGEIGTRLMRWIADATGKATYSYALAFTSQNLDYFSPTSLTKAFYEDGTQNALFNNYNLFKSYVAATGRLPTRYLFIQGAADAGTTQASYYARLRILFDATRVDYPGIKWTIVKTIGANTVGVGLAQKQLADENPGVVDLIDNSDMYPIATSFYQDPHFTSYAGRQEVFECIKAKLLGLPARPTVPQTPHIDSVLAFTETYQSIRSIAGTDPTTGLPQLVVWQPNSGVNSLSGDGSHVAASVNFNRRSTARLVAASGDAYFKAGTGRSAASWTVFGVGQLTAFAVPTMLFEIRDAAAANRWGFQPVAGGGVANLWYGGASLVFPGALVGFNSDQRSWGVVLDTPGLLASLYINGLLASTVAISGAVNVVNASYYVGSLSDVSQFWDGEIAMIAIAPGVVGTAAQMAACHAWAKLEYGLAV